MSVPDAVLLIDNGQNCFLDTPSAVIEKVIRQNMFAGRVVLLNMVLCLRLMLSGRDMHCTLRLPD